MYGAFIHAFAHVALCVCGSRRLNDKFPHRYRLATAARMRTEWAHLEQVMAACLWLHGCPSACGCFFLQVSATGSSETRIIRLFTRPVLTSASSLPKPGNRQNEKMPWGLNSFAPHHEKASVLASVPLPRCAHQPGSQRRHARLQPSRPTSFLRSRGSSQRKARKDSVIQRSGAADCSHDY